MLLRTFGYNRPILVALHSLSLKPISFGYKAPPIRFSQAGGQSAHKARPPTLNSRWRHWAWAQGIRESLFIVRQRWPHRDRRESLRSLCKTSGTGFKRKFMRKWRQFWLMDSVFLVLVWVNRSTEPCSYRPTVKEVNCRAVSRVETGQTLWGGIRCFVPGWPNIVGDVSPASPVALTPMELDTHVSVCLSVRPSVSLSLSVCLSVCRLICLCVCSRVSTLSLYSCTRCLFMLAWRKLKIYVFQF